MARVTWSPTALDQLEGVVRWIARKAPATATKWGRKITGATEILVSQPEIGSPVEDSARPGYRQLLVGPYRVIYRFDGTTCWVSAVLHGSQDIDRWLPADDSP